MSINSILHVRLKCPEIYPSSVIYLADWVHKQRSHVNQHILDMVLVDERHEESALVKAIEEHDPDAVAFSWRNMQPFSPNEEDKSLYYALTFYHSRNPISRALAAAKGIQIVWDYNNRVRRNFALIHLVKERFPGKAIWAGGPAFGLFLDIMTARCPEGTVAVGGEGESAIIKLIDGADPMDENVAIKRNGKLIFGQKAGYFSYWEESTPVDFDYIASIFPNFEHYLKKDYEVAVLTKRGCPYKCAFCAYGYIDGYKVRFRRPEVIADEVEMLVKRFGVKKIWFCDSQFYPSRHSLPIVEQTLDEIISRRLDIRWATYLRIDNITPSLAQKMVDSGLRHLRLSITSGSQLIMDRLKIGLKLDRFLEACKLMKAAGYQGTVNLDLSLNAPGETQETILETIDTVEKVAEIFGRDVVKPFIIFLAIQPRTTLAKYAIAKGHLRPDFNPLALTPFSIRKLVHNPPPLGRPIGRALINAMESHPDEIGWQVLAELREEFATSTPRIRPLQPRAFPE